MGPNEWPPMTRPFRASPPEGAAGVVLPVSDTLRFFKSTYHSVLDFTDYRFMFTVVDVMSGLPLRSYLDSSRRINHVNVLQYQKDHNVAAAWNMGLRFMFSFATVKYGVCLQPGVVVEPFWLSQLVRTLEQWPKAGLLVPQSNGRNSELFAGCFAFRREQYEAAGGFDETKESSGEALVDFAMRVERLGFQTESHPSVYIHKFKIVDLVQKREAGIPERAIENKEAATHVGT